nr:unnamed protein product [Callosobruchus chinensis]
MPKNIHEIVKPLKWLIGKWKTCEAVVSYPTMPEAVEYEETLSITSIGQPLLNFVTTAWDPIKNEASHLEAGYLIPSPNGRTVTLCTATNIGVATVEEGEIKKENVLKLRSRCIGHSGAWKLKTTVIERTYTLNEEGRLSYHLLMETTDTPLTEHLRAIYEKLPDFIP